MWNKKRLFAVRKVNWHINRVLFNPGYGLVEVLIAGGVLAILMLAAASMVNFMMLGVRNAEIISNFKQAVSMVNLVVYNPTGCAANFGQGSANPNLSFDSNTNPSPTLILNQLNYPPPSNVAILVAGKAVPGQYIVSSLVLNKFIPLSTNAYLAYISIQANKVKPYLGSPTLSTDIPIALSVSKSGSRVSITGCDISGGSGPGSSPSPTPSPTGYTTLSANGGLPSNGTKSFYCPAGQNMYNTAIHCNCLICRSCPQNATVSNNVATITCSGMICGTAGTYVCGP